MAPAARAIKVDSKSARAAPPCKAITAVVIRTKIKTTARKAARCAESQQRPSAQPMHADNGPGRGGPGGPRGEGPHDWHRGDRLPNDYRDRQYVVDDYHGYGLQQPPRGYHWVGVNGDYVLAAIATGVIAQIVLSNGH
jgi:Ni/Co efflux regulator RcnB